MGNVFRMPGDDGRASGGSGRSGSQGKGSRNGRSGGKGFPAGHPFTQVPGLSRGSGSGLGGVGRGAAGPPNSARAPRPLHGPGPASAGRQGWLRANSGGRARVHRPPVPREFCAGRYRLESRLGGGAGSDLYRAADRLLRRPVVLKVYRQGPGGAAERLFRDEARQLAWLEHPNLVTLYDAGIEGGHPFLVLRYVDGVTLERRLEQGPLTADQTAAVGARIADALTYIHERGVTHGDLRPSCVLVDEHDVFLSDFGITRMTGLQTGNSAYLAPEQLRGGKVGPAADIYSLGLLLAECLTGEAQYPGGALASAVARLTTRPRIPEGLPEPLHDALEAMTAADPGERPDAEECRAAFALCDPTARPVAGLDDLPGHLPAELVGPVADPRLPVEPDADTISDSIADNVLFFPFQRRWTDAPAARREPAVVTPPTPLRQAERLARVVPLTRIRPSGTRRPHLRGWVKLIAASAAAAALATGLIQMESASASEAPPTTTQHP
ncbi:MAG: serine/threonine kinase [Actinomycetia bacterium]|nr:serine/threonine kinase [Actinomycetes bacterium]MDQ1653052.1 eukaryotic-like serine/threonine-protein kinase [Cryptosporangiaceae bacterium]